MRLLCGSLRNDEGGVCDYSILRSQLFNTERPTIELLSTKSSTFAPSVLNTLKMRMELSDEKFSKNRFLFENYTHFVLEYTFCFYEKTIQSCFSVNVC